MARSTIVVAIDESSASRKALEWAMQYVYREGVEVHLVTVMQPINYGEFERL
jgi:nucleotide-binding universal stress UspA family protein